ncbi:hypothetical protein GTQ34_07920 [Muricauda sp. JGD-17]|uniref:DUF4332 domain-containing protein n=1 Tax=Flagellimonas ochracea TaxID=2696472 RepID=A0A964WXA0_9FLAO|nr:hypothetical protein [Allomuricauda ochracea]NAY91840.1 hypothetical protein [Allomuricauda ochracea]
MNTENLNIWCWIIPILIGLISGILGYLMGKMKTPSVPDNKESLKSLEVDSARLKTELDACRKKLSAMEKMQKTSSSLTSSKVATPPSTSAFDAEAAKAALGKKIKQDDLKIVEGIGPKIEGLFHKFGIKTWKALSETTTDKCQEVLNSGGDRYRIHDPASWPMQAKMAHMGQWKELAQWQDDHKAGKF